VKNSEMTSNKEEIQVSPRKSFRLTKAVPMRNKFAINVTALLFLAVGMVTVASAATEQQLVDESANTLRAFYEMPERQIPRRILSNARGLAIIRVFKGGFIFSGKGGQGVLVARTSNGWSGPSFIGLGGAGWGLQVGGEMTDFIF